MVDGDDPGQRFQRLGRLVRVALNRQQRHVKGFGALRHVLRRLRASRQHQRVQREVERGHLDVGPPSAGDDGLVGQPVEVVAAPLGHEPADQEVLDQPIEPRCPREQRASQQLHHLADRRREHQPLLRQHADHGRSGRFELRSQAVGGIPLRMARPPVDDEPEQRVAIGLAPSRDGSRAQPTLVRQHAQDLRLEPLGESAGCRHRAAVRVRVRGRVDDDDPRRLLQRTDALRGRRHHRPLHLAVRPGDARVVHREQACVGAAFGKRQRLVRGRLAPGAPPRGRQRRSNGRAAHSGTRANHAQDAQWTLHAVVDGLAAIIATLGPRPPGCITPRRPRPPHGTLEHPAL